MRFSRLSLERYGRFENCELHFRSGAPDLHVIYGANEAGKTTSLAAVSDLLFGFPARSPYNFIFDYSLLRVGAGLEDGGRTLSCRRKKGTIGTLLDEGDAAIDEAPLITMLKGQTRDTFGLSFSLDQDGLRSGGRAMVEAKNDVGRTIFAAGSGLTGVASELKKLEMEAEAIWGPTLKGSRTFTQAQRAYSDAVKSVRDGALKPKAWSDAKATYERALEALEAARLAREAVQAELRTAERVRRLAPVVREREERVEALKAFAGAPDIGRQREDAADELIREADEAVRVAAAAQLLRDEIADRRSRVPVDPRALEETESIDQLVADSGAEAKAAHDLVEIEERRLAAAAAVARLRDEAGTNADVALPRPVAAKLRELALAHSEHQAASHQIAESREGIDDRRRRAQAMLEASPTFAGAEELIEAVDAARSLGADADERVEMARRKEKQAGEAVVDAVNRLAPWVGEISELSKLPMLGEQEIDDGRGELAEIALELRREEDMARRSADESAAVALEIEQTSTGSAVSPEEVTAVREIRQAHWRPLRDHVLDGIPLPDPRHAIENFEASVAAVDERLERRFDLAEASSRLSLHEKAKAGHDLAASLAAERASALRERHERALEAWLDRLAKLGLPVIEPTRMQAWQADRLRAEKLNSEYRELLAEAARTESKRDAVRRDLASALSTDDPEGALAPVLLSAERRRREIEEALQNRRVAQSELDQVAIDAQTLDQRQQKLDPEIATSTAEWHKVLGEAGLELEVVTCGAVLNLLDELREAVTAEALLRQRIDGIARDARGYARRVESLADGLGITAGDTPTRLRGLRERAVSARSAANLLESLNDEDRRRRVEVEEAQARLTAAEEALAPLLVETGTIDRAALSIAIERSRSLRSLRETIAAIEQRIIADGDGLSLDELIGSVTASDPDLTAERVSTLNARLSELTEVADGAATALGDARRAFSALDTEGTSAVDAASDAEQAKSELEVLAEHYLLKRAQAVTLKWAIEKYRERHQDPLLKRAGELFSILTTGRYATLKVDTDGASPRLLGLRDDQRTMVEVDAMSEGTTDQLFLSLRLAALEQSVAAGISLPFLADDLFVNFDDQRAEAGFRVLAEVAKSTQVLFFTHHPHLVDIAKSVVGAQHHSECALT